MKEKWMSIVGYEGLYEVSNMGRIKSLKASGGSNSKIRKLQLNKKLGYLYIGLHKNSKVSMQRVHRIVAKAFIPNLENKPDVNHIDGNKTNNHVSNLEWCSKKENMQHYTKKLKTYVITKNHREKLNQANRKIKGKPTIKFNKQGEIIAEFETASDAAKDINTGRGNIINCCNGKVKSVRGFIYKYKEDILQQPKIYDVEIDTELVDSDKFKKLLDDSDFRDFPEDLPN